MSSGRKVTALFFCLFFSGWMHIYICAETKSPIGPADIKVLHYQKLDYPAPAQPAQGVVVVRVKLDNSGRVADAEALSGNDDLIAGTLTNVRTWMFEPNASHSAVVVYNFRILRGQCKSASSFFTFERPNFATITACLPELSPRSKDNSTIRRDSPAMISDREMEVIDFAEMKSSLLAKKTRNFGVVVVQARLDDDGRVMDALPVYGHSLLISDCLKNVKEWRFRPNAKKMAVVVYWFGFPCETAPEDAEQFLFLPPNFVRIAASLTYVISSDNSLPNDWAGTVTAEAIKTPYPEGIVVIRARLDKKGKVISAEALSGSDALIPDLLADVKKARFDPNISRSEIVIYNYRIADGQCKSASSYVSNDPPGFITINQCRPESSKPRGGDSAAQTIMRAMVSDQDMEVLDYEEMKYPEIGMRERISRMVLVQAALDENGNVTDAFSILGDRVLAPDCLANIKKWRFRPNAKRMAIVAYLFTFPCGEAPEGQSQFVLYPRNLVEVTSTGMEANSIIYGPR